MFPKLHRFGRQERSISSEVHVTVREPPAAIKPRWLRPGLWWTGQRGVQHILVCGRETPFLRQSLAPPVQYKGETLGKQCAGLPSQWGTVAMKIESDSRVCKQAPLKSNSAHLWRLPAVSCHMATWIKHQGWTWPAKGSGFWGSPSGLLAACRSLTDASSHTMAAAGVNVHFKLRRRLWPRFRPCQRRPEAKKPYK